MGTKLLLPQRHWGPKTGADNCVLVVTQKPLLPRVLTNSATDLPSTLTLLLQGDQRITYSLPSNYLVLHALASPSVHHTCSPLSSCHLAQYLLYGEESGVPLLLTPRPDNESLSAIRQPARLRCNAFTFVLWKRTAYTKYWEQPGAVWVEMEAVC